MTQPKIETFRRGGARWYRNPETGGEFIGVTSITGLTPKPWLGPWQAKLTAEYATENIGSVLQMMLDAEKAADPARARKAVQDHVKAAPRRFTSAAADRGTEIHAICEAFAKGENPFVPKDLEPWVAGYRRFLDKYQPEFLWIEGTVFNEDYGYAGTCDWIARIEGDTILGDIKSSRVVGAEAAAQVCLYSRGSYLLELVEPEPSLTTITEPTIRQVPMPDISGGLVVHLRDDHAELVTVDIGDEVFDTAVALMQVHKWESDISRRVLGKPVAL